MNITYRFLCCFLLVSSILFSGFAQKNKQKSAVQTATVSNDQTGILYLSGEDAATAVDWDFKCSDGRNSGVWTKIKVPSCWELQGFGTYQYGMSFYGKATPAGIANEQGFYKTTFKLPAEWEGRIIRLVFEGVMTDCSANINNRRCIKLHQGGFYRFYSDVSDRVYFGDKENLLEVFVSKESANSSVNLAERRADYWNFGGIFRPVFIEALPIFNINRVAIDAQADGSFYADVFMGCALGENYQVQTTLTDADGKMVGKPILTKVTNGADKVIVRGNFQNVQPWTAETPSLYRVHFALMQEGKTQHQLTQRIGFRTVEVREGDGLYINGQKIMAKGVNRHSFRPETGRALSKEDQYEDIRLIKEMNMNAVRMSHYPPDPAFLDACDELGLYVLNELGGWHGKYDTEVGKKLVYEMITRDVNHPSIIWWSNGNEGGWNTELDQEFQPLDPQKRPVLHPQGNFGGFETMHYRSYGESQEYMRKPEIFMPTEILHGLYDGGHGAGLWEYWDMMRKHSRSAGAFLWVFADEGVMRTDQNNRIDNVGNYGADGIVGPNHEKEGSFYTVRQIWCPIQISPEGQPKEKISREEAMRSNQNSFIVDPKAFAGKFNLENCYDFINTKECSFEWELARFYAPGENKSGHESLQKGKATAPDVKAHDKGQLTLPLPKDWEKADVLYVSAFSPSGECLYRWGYYWKTTNDLLQGIFSVAKDESESKTAAKATLSCQQEGDLLKIQAGATTMTFQSSTGCLQQLGSITFSNGPRFIAARRADRSMDVFYNHDDKLSKSKERIYSDISGKSKVSDFRWSKENEKIIIDVDYQGNLRHIRWDISSDGQVSMTYEYQYEGTVELAGICFDYPEEQMQSIRFLGKGPYRVWQNRMHGTVMDVWENEYNDPIPGESFTYPEFKGYFNDWKWADFSTSQGKLLLGNNTPNSFLGVYTPRDGRDVILYTIPQSGIAVLDVIPGVRNKVNSTDLVGPSSQAKWLSGPQKGQLLLRVR